MTETCRSAGGGDEHRLRADDLLRVRGEGDDAGFVVGVVAFRDEITVGLADRFALVSLLGGEAPWTATGGDGASRRLRRPRTLSLVPAGVELVLGCGGRGELLAIVADRCTVDAVAGPRAAALKEPVVDLWDPHVAELVRILRHELGKAGDSHDPVAGRLAASLLGMAGRIRRGRQQACALDEAQVESVHAFIAENIESPNLVGPLAEALGMTPGRFTKAFTQTLGMTPSRYIQERRIERVRELLETTDMPLAEIAFAAGFSSQAHMSERFHHIVGCPPGAYRRRIEGEDAGAGARPCRPQDPVNSSVR